MAEGKLSAVLQRLVGKTQARCRRLVVAAWLARDQGKRAERLFEAAKTLAPDAKPPAVHTH